MTELERLELVLRRVCDRLDKSTRFVASDELYMLKVVLEELTNENIRVAKRDEIERKRA
jgi:hypothetical protein